ncbi:hypothetical protein [Kordiimonas sp.]|uniref:hypothetical protein n=1 Tax=Kordiimonas sp. TaxID=1970157 RepID=UPI003A923A2D
MATATFKAEGDLGGSGYLLPSLVKRKRHLLTGQYVCAVKSWIKDIGLDPASYGTHSLW